MIALVGIGNILGNRFDRVKTLPLNSHDINDACYAFYKSCIAVDLNFQQGFGTEKIQNKSLIK